MSAWTLVIIRRGGWLTHTAFLRRFDPLTILGQPLQLWKETWRRGLGSGDGPNLVRLPTLALFENRDTSLAALAHAKLPVKGASSSGANVSSSPWHPLWTVKHVFGS